VSVSLDHFALFGLAPRFAIDLETLEAAYKRVQAQVHPDRFAAGSATERRVAMQWATQANEAYRTLRDDARRAAYLCERAGVPIDAESNTAMPVDFLMQQLEWREALDEARATGKGHSDVRSQVEAARSATIAQLAAALDTAQDATRAAALVRQLMFIDKFRADVLAGDEAPARDAVGG
jgi:molecular chaperone HscB